MTQQELSDEGFKSVSATGQQGVPAIDRAVRALDALAETSFGLTLSELSRAVGAPKSSMLAVCSSLLAGGLLLRDGTRYRLGPKVVRLSSKYLARINLATEFWIMDSEDPILAEETIVLSRLEDTQTSYLAARPGSRPVGVTYQTGMRLPAHCTASGKSQLAMLSDKEVASRYAGEVMEGLTEHSIDSVPRLLIELASIRSEGYAVDDEETARGMLCVGAAVTDVSGKPAGALSVSMVKAGISKSDISAAQVAICAFAKRLTERIGGVPSEGA